MAEVTLRPAEERDFPLIKEYYLLLNDHFYKTGYHLPQPEDLGEAYLDSFRRTLGRFSNAWMAEVDGKIVGYILCRMKRTPAYFGGVLVGEISDMWIIPEARRLGLGDRLSRTAIEWLRAQGVHSIEIQVLLGNEISWNLYQRMGFQLEFRVARLLFDQYVDPAVIKEAAALDSAPQGVQEPEGS
jgi:ribosomal protein S18 acetylase RimI-like enzyme